MGGGVSVLAGKVACEVPFAGRERRISGVAAMGLVADGVYAEDGAKDGGIADGGTPTPSGWTVGVDGAHPRDNTRRTMKPMMSHPQPLRHPAQPNGASVTLRLPQRGHCIERALPFGYQVYRHVLQRLSQCFGKRMCRMGSPDDTANSGVPGSKCSLSGLNREPKKARPIRRLPTWFILLPSRVAPEWPAVQCCSHHRLSGGECPLRVGLAWVP